MDGKKATVLSSEEGVHQGDPLEPCLFSITIQDILVKIQKANPNAVILAYLDDVCVGTS